MNTLVAMPCSEEIKSKTALCLVGLVSSTPIYRLEMQIDTYCDRAHNSICENALHDPKVDVVLFIDSDQEFPANSLTRLAARKKDIVGATYRRRQPPFPLMGRYPGGEEIDPNDNGCREVEYIPSGLLLVRRKVLEAIPFPHFPNLYGKSGDAFVGSDVSFCRKARFHGFKVHCDLDLSREVTHLATETLTFEPK